MTRARIRIMATTHIKRLSRGGRMAKYAPAAALVAAWLFFGHVGYAEPTIGNFPGNLDTAGGPGSLSYFNGVTTSGAVNFGTADSFGLPTMDGGQATVMEMPAFAQSQAIGLLTGTPANGGGSYGNQYTLGYDILVPDSGAGWFAFYNTTGANANDGEAFINPSNRGIGIGGDYEGVIRSNEWYRVVYAVDLAQADATQRMKKYINGKLVGTNSLAGLDGRHSTYVGNNGANPGIDIFLFADDSGDTNAGFVSSVLHEDRTYSEAEVRALGAPHAAGFSQAGLPGTTFVWNYDSGDLTVKKEVGGTATMDFFNADSQALTDFGNTASTAAVPDVPDGPAPFLHHTQFGGGGAGGYGIDYTGVDANGGGSYVNTYTMIWDVYIPDLNWTPLFNTNFNHANDADLYVAGNGAVGIGALGYSAAGEVREDTWHRIGIVHDRDAGTVKYFVDGTEIFSGGAGGTDGRHSLYTGSHAGLDMLVDGEGDGSGNYSNEVYLSSFLFSDVAFDPAMMADLGGVTAAGIALSPEAAVPEPSALVLLGLGIAALAIFRRRRRGAN